MDFQTRVKKSNLPMKQQRVIDAILNDLESNSFLSGQEICLKFDISLSSLTRMAKALNLQGFPQLKKEIEILYKKETSPTYQAENFLLKASNSSILETILKDELKSLNVLKENLEEGNLQRISKEIYKSSRIFLIGVGQLQPIINKVRNNLEVLGKEIITFKNMGFSKEIELYQVNTNDIVILASINKELSESLSLLKDMENNNITSVLITDKKYGQLQKNASYTLYAPSKGNGSLNDLAPFHILTNILECYFFSIDEHVHLKKIQKVEKSWNSLPIFLQ